MGQRIDDEVRAAQLLIQHYENGEIYAPGNSKEKVDIGNLDDWRQVYAPYVQDDDRITNARNLLRSKVEYKHVFISKDGHMLAVYKSKAIMLRIAKASKDRKRYCIGFKTRGGNPKLTFAHYITAIVWGSDMFDSDIICDRIEKFGWAAFDRITPDGIVIECHHKNANPTDDHYTNLRLFIRAIHRKTHSLLHKTDDLDSMVSGLDEIRKEANLPDDRAIIHWSNERYTKDGVRLPDDSYSDLNDFKVNNELTKLPLFIAIPIPQEEQSEQ